MTRDASLNSLIQSSKGRTVVPCLDHVFLFLNRGDLTRTILVCRSWQIPSAKKLWSSFKFTRDREFERIFNILSRHDTLFPYGTFVTALDIVHSERDFIVSANIIFLISTVCPNLESISITFDNTRPVAPPIPHPAKPRPPLPPIARPDEVKKPRYSHSLPLAHFAHNCPNIKAIRLVSYSPKTDDSVYEMAKFMKAGALERITLSGCITIQSSTLCKLAIVSPRLRFVEIMGNTPVSDSSLATLADRCGASFEHLSIGNAYQITDKSLRYVALRCKKIKQICMFNNNPSPEHFSEDALTAIVTHCPTLEIINLSDARSLGPLFFNAVVQRVSNEMTTINQRKRPYEFGLKRICLGNVRRDVIHSSPIQKLIDMSASKHDKHTSEEDEEDAGMDTETSLTHIMTNLKFMPKATIIRGNTIWWQRRQLRPKS